MKYKLILNLKMKMTSDNKTNCFFRKKLFDFAWKIIVDTHVDTTAEIGVLPAVPFHLLIIEISYCLLTLERKTTYL